MIIKAIRKLRCKLGDHELYSIAQDLNFNFSRIDLENMSADEVAQKFHEVTTIRCRHCNYTY